MQIHMTFVLSSNMCNDNHFRYPKCYEYAIVTQVIAMSLITSRFSSVMWYIKAKFA